MFDKVTIMPTEHTTQVVDRHIHINRAPTDESVKLLKEFEEKAKEKFLGQFRVESNSLKACAVYLHHNITGEREVFVKFTLNGKEHRAEINLGHSWVDGEKGRQEIITRVHQKLSEIIAGTILIDSNKDWVMHLK